MRDKLAESAEKEIEEFGMTTKVIPIDLVKLAEKDCKNEDKENILGLKEIYEHHDNG